MSERSEIAEAGRALDLARKARHAHWQRQNVDALNAARLPYRVTNGGLCLLLRERGKPAVDFYPTTGRWKANGKTHSGHAAQFLAWYAKQPGRTI